MAFAKYVLCHKCAGLLGGTSSLPSRRPGMPAPLLECGCISGYIRGTEPQLSLEDAIVAQIVVAETTVALFERQGRSPREIREMQTILAQRWDAWEEVVQLDHLMSLLP